MITPDEYRELAKTKAAHLEERIDKALRNAADAGAGVGQCVTIAINELPASVVDSVVARYAKAGWTIGVMPDARDGDFISIALP